MDLVRSLLFVPGHKFQMFQKALLSGADGLIFDLEDSVPSSEKKLAREQVGEALREHSSIPRYVRINGFESRESEDWLRADLRAVIGEGVSGIILPKAESADEIKTLDREMQKLESKLEVNSGKIEIVPFIESARGIHFTYDILTSSSRTGSVIIGTAEDGDLVTDLGCRWSREGVELLYARSKVLLEARAAGIEHPLDGVFLGLDDEEGLIRDAKNAKDLGYRGKTVIHPRQVNPVNQVFSPCLEEMDYYREMIERFEKAEKTGSGAISYKGKMIDRAMVKKAHALLAQAFSLEQSIKR